MVKERLAVPFSESLRVRFDTLLERFTIQLEPEVYAYCQDGLRTMTKSPDPCHALPHIERMFGYLQDFLQHSEEHVDMSVLLTAICHHDVWRVIHFIPSLVNTFIVNKLESTYAAQHIKDEMEQRGFAKEFIENVTYCIEMHAESRNVPRLTTESKLLYDFDCMDMHSWERIGEYRAYLKNTHLPNELISLYQSATSLLRHVPPHSYYYPQNYQLAKNIQLDAKLQYARA